MDFHVTLRRDTTGKLQRGSILDYSLLIVILYRSTIDSKCSIGVFSSLLEQTRRPRNNIILRRHGLAIRSHGYERVFLCGTNRAVSGLGYLVHAFTGHICCCETPRSEASDDR